MNTIFNKRLFWDIDISKLDKNTDKKIIIERVVEHGTLEESKWLRENYTQEEISEIIINTSNISRRSARFWQTILDIKEPIKCLERSFQNTPNKLWN